MFGMIGSDLGERKEAAFKLAEIILNDEMSNMKDN